MARGLAIRSIVTHPDNRVEVAYSHGSPVAPAGQDGTFSFQNLAAVQEEIKALEASLSVYQLAMMHLAITWRQPNGTFGNINQVTNKELRFDTTAAQPLKIV